MPDTTNVRDLELMEGWGEDDRGMRVRFAFPISAATGAESSAVVYFEVAPGEHLGRHTDSAEEILYIAEGEGVAIAGDERVEIRPGSLVLIPALVPHELHATGDRAVKVVGFFAAARVEHVFDRTIQPMGLTHLATPPAEVLA